MYKLFTSKKNYELLQMYAFILLDEVVYIHNS